MCSTLTGLAPGTTGGTSVSTCAMSRAEAAAAGTITNILIDRFEIIG
jgi:hypothetical protein